VGVEVVALVADHHQLAGLVGREQERRAEPPQQRGEVRRVASAQWAGVFHLGNGRVRRRAGRGTLVSQDFLQRPFRRRLASARPRSCLARRGFSASLACSYSCRSQCSLSVATLLDGGQDARDLAH